MAENVSTKKKELTRSIKFTLFSISAGVIQISSFTLLTAFSGLRYWPCYLISLALSVVYNFTINRRFTFRSAANIPLAMLKVFAYYCVFTPLTTVVGDYLVELCGWNGFIVELLSMAFNFVTEFLYTRYIVYGKDVDTNKAYIEKYGDSAASVTGPAVSRGAKIICAISTVISVAVIAAVLVFGNTPENMIKGEWRSYRGDLGLTYSFGEDGKAVFADDEGNIGEYTYSFDDGFLTLYNGEKTYVYQWSDIAVNFLCDNQYGEIRNIIALRADEIEDFSGYAYCDGDFLYIGLLNFCRTSKLDTDAGEGLQGRWIGTAGDRLSFGSDGSYAYREYEVDYNGTYSVDDSGDLILTLKGQDSVVEKDKWGIEGRTLRISDRYYFRAE